MDKKIEEFVANLCPSCDAKDTELKAYKANSFCAFCAGKEEELKEQTRKSDVIIAEKDAEVELHKERWQLEQIRYEGISSANEELRAELKRLREAVEMLPKQLYRAVNLYRESDTGEREIYIENLRRKAKEG
jgi:predicted RNase H-like nuclease (RuvC/YqgF family)